MSYKSSRMGGTSDLNTLSEYYCDCLHGVSSRLVQDLRWVRDPKGKAKGERERARRHGRLVCSSVSRAKHEITVVYCLSMRADVGFINLEWIT
jgi:hypothetical protein